MEQIVNNEETTPFASATDTSPIHIQTKVDDAVTEIGKVVLGKEK